MAKPMTITKPVATPLPWRAYLEMTKPRVVALMLLTVLVGMCLAVPGAVPVQPLIAGLVGIDRKSVV